MAKKKQQRGRSSARTQSRTQSRTSSRSKSSGTGTRKSAQQHAGSAREQHERARNESGLPGGGQGRRDAVGDSKVYPASGGQAPADAEIRNMASWGQGERGAQGYFDSGGSELVPRDGQLLGGLDVGPSGAPITDQTPEGEASNAARPSSKKQQH